MCSGTLAGLIHFVNYLIHFVAGLFGICNYGVDINGYIMDPVKGLCIWLQRRSQTKQTWPGRWDNMVIPISC